MNTTRQYNKFSSGVIALSALLVGSLDLFTSCAIFVKRSGRPFTDVLLYIASAIFGPAAYNGQPMMPWWGVIFHYAIAFIFTTLFFMLYPLIRKGIRNTFLIAILYGIFIWIVMNLLVLPVSHVKMVPYTAFGISVGTLILIIMIGLPLSVVADRVSAPANK